jgi:hypothetical protein
MGYDNYEDKYECGCVVGRREDDGGASGMGGGSYYFRKNICTQHRTLLREANARGRGGSDGFWGNEQRRLGIPCIPRSHLDSERPWYW